MGVGATAHFLCRFAFRSKATNLVPVLVTNSHQLGSTVTYETTCTACGVTLGFTPFDSLGWHLTEERLDNLRHRSSCVAN